MTRRLATNLLTGLVLVCFYAASHGALLQHRADSGAARTARHATGIWSLPPAALRAIAGEFKGLLADYLTLEAGAQLGTELVRVPTGGFRVVKKKYDWPAIERLFVASQALDPAFAQTYILAQGWLPWDAKMFRETQAILRTAARNRPWDWRPLHFMGFDAYYFLNKPGEAGKIFIEAGKIPHAPPFLAILGARLAQKGGETKAAIVLMKSMLVDKPETDPGYQDIVDRLHALEGTYVLEQAIKKYKATYKTVPQSLHDLLAPGILAKLPANPYNLPYCLDEKGVVYFDKPNCRASMPATGEALQ